VSRHRITGEKRNQPRNRGGALAARKFKKKNKADTGEAFEKSTREFSGTAVGKVVWEIGRVTGGCKNHRFDKKWTSEKRGEGRREEGNKHVQKLRAFLHSKRKRGGG